MKLSKFLSYLYILASLNSLSADEGKINIGPNGYKIGMSVIFQDRVGKDNIVKRFMRPATKAIPDVDPKSYIQIEGLKDPFESETFKTIKKIKGYTIEDIAHFENRCCWGQNTITASKTHLLLGFIPWSQEKCLIKTNSCLHNDKVSVNEDCPFTTSKSYAPALGSGFIMAGLSTIVYCLWKNNN